VHAVSDDRDEARREAAQPSADASRAWRPPTRRAFVAMLGAAAAALAVRHTVEAPGAAPVEPPEPAPRPWTGSTRWIGHC